MFNKTKESPEAAPVEAQMQSEFPRQPASHNGNSVGYSVEVRYGGRHPVQIGAMLLGSEWQRLKTEKVPAPFGVPIARPWNECLFSMLSLYDYSAAQALRWWFHASADAAMIGSLSLESRIIAHEVKYSFSESAISAHMNVQGDDRSNFMPDWGKKATSA